MAHILDKNRLARTDYNGMLISFDTAWNCLICKISYHMINKLWQLWSNGVFFLFLINGGFYRDKHICDNKRVIRTNFSSQQKWHKSNMNGTLFCFDGPTSKFNSIWSNEPSSKRKTQERFFCHWWSVFQIFIWHVISGSFFSSFYFFSSHSILLVHFVLISCLFVVLAQARPIFFICYQLFDLHRIYVSILFMCRICLGGLRFFFLFLLCVNTDIHAQNMIFRRKMNPYKPLKKMVSFTIPICVQFLRFIWKRDSRKCRKED